MDIHEKIKKMRMLKGWSQEEFAEKLNLSSNGYAKIERGERSMNLERLQQIANALNIELLQLLDLDEKNVFTNVIVDNGSTANNFAEGSIVLSETQCVHKLEKASLLLAERDKEIAYLKNENKHLQEIIDLLKSQNGT